MRTNQRILCFVDVFRFGIDFRKRARGCDCSKTLSCRGGRCVFACCFVLDSEDHTWQQFHRSVRVANHANLRCECFSPVTYLGELYISAGMVLGVLCVAKSFDLHEERSFV